LVGCGVRGIRRPPPRAIASPSTSPIRWMRSFVLKVYLVDGTYELFRHYFAVPKARDAQGREVGAVRGVLASLLAMMREGVTHIGVATDHVIESFRNNLWHGYKTGEGIEPDLLSQFPILEEVLTAAGLVVWPMVEFEADDALASAAELAAMETQVEQVIICTPDKDLAQSVSGTRVVQLVRRTGVTIDEAGVIAKFGVPPASIPDYLALVGDTADGYPGLPGWGAKSTAAVLAKFGHIESIPSSPRDWLVNIANSTSLADVLVTRRKDALLFRTLATLKTDIPLFASVDELRWSGPTPAFDAIGQLLDKAITEKKPKPDSRPKRPSRHTAG
jgi:5'-3' exonuclease